MVDQTETISFKWIIGCRNCKGLFGAMRRDAKYCSQHCKSAAARRRKEEVK